MIKQELLRGQIVQVNMYNLSRTINSKAVFNQKDMKTAMLLCQLTMDGALNLTGCSVSAEILKSDGKTVIQKAQIVDATNGLVAVGLTEQCLSAIGTAQCEIVVQTENQILYSPKISYMVVDNLFDLEGVESTDELPILNVLIAEVLKVQKELDVLETTITNNESARNLQEETRKTNEETRKESMKTIESDFEEIVNTSNTKVEEVNDKIVEVNDRIVAINNTLESTLEQVGESVSNMETTVVDKIKEIDSTLESTLDEIERTLDSKIGEVNSTLDSKIGEVDRELESKIGEVDVAIEKMDSSVVAKISEINSKLNQVDSTINRINDEFNTKLQSVDKSLQDKLAKVDESLNSKLVQITNQVNEKLAGYDAKVLEINNKLKEVDTKITEVNTKLSNYDTKITEVNDLISTVNSQESNRVQAEQNRTNTFNSIVAELEVNQSDIDDILGMVGGL